MKRHAWIVSIAILAACSAEQESARPTSQTEAPAAPVASSSAAAANEPARSATSSSATSQAQPAAQAMQDTSMGKPMQGQSAQDVRAEAPASSRADIARATALPAMTQPKPGPTNKSVPVHPAASKPAPASSTAKAAAHHATPTPTHATQQAASETTKAASTGAAPSPASPAAAVAAEFNVKPCKSCHAVNKTRVGPAWKDVAAAYGSPEELARAFKAGFKVSDRKLASADPKWKRKATLMTGTFKRLIRGHEDAAAQALFAAVKRGHI